MFTYLLGMQVLAASLASPQFPPEGRVLGFVCQFQYSHTSQHFSKLMLRGPDAVIVAAAESLGLSSWIVPIWPKDGLEDWDCGGGHVCFCGAVEQNAETIVSAHLFDVVSGEHEADVYRISVLWVGCYEACWSVFIPSV